MSKKIQCDCLIFISQLELDGRSELYLSKLKKEAFLPLSFMSMRNYWMSFL
jgi:hypothetical protein